MASLTLSAACLSDSSGGLDCSDLIPFLLVRCAVSTPITCPNDCKAPEMKRPPPNPRASAHMACFLRQRLLACRSPSSRHSRTSRSRTNPTTGQEMWGGLMKATASGKILEKCLALNGALSLLQPCSADLGVVHRAEMRISEARAQDHRQTQPFSASWRSLVNALRPCFLPCSPCPACAAFSFALPRPFLDWACSPCYDVQHNF